MSYLHIDNLYKNQDILLFRECWAMEKIHGTSAHIAWDGTTKNLRFFSGGAKHEEFHKLFDSEYLAGKFSDEVGTERCTIYGEAYGGKQQGMAKTYGPVLRFVAFDVKMEDAWLSMASAAEVVARFGLEFVHGCRIPTDLAAIDAERDADSVQAMRNGMGTGHMREGVVLRPMIEVRKNNGERIIAKHKRAEFAERQHQPKVVSLDRHVVLEQAQAIADEWVVPMRLEHVLQGLPHVVGMEQTQDVIRAMIADVYREAAGEIIESKEVSSAIGRKTAQLWKARVVANLYPDKGDV